MSVQGYAARVRAAANAGLNACAIYYVGQVRRVLSAKSTARDGPAGSSAGEPPALRTGTLARSIAHAMYPSRMAARVGTNIKYARILEFGGVIGGTMTVPLNNAARKMRRQNASLRSVPGLFGLKVRGKTFLVRKKAKGELEWLFILKDSIRIAPRPFLRPTFAAARSRFGTIFRETAKASLRG